MNARKSQDDYPPTRRQKPRHTSAYDADTVADEDEDDGQDAWPPRMQRSAIPYQYTTRQQQPPVETRRTHDIPARASAPVRQPAPPSHANRGLVPVARRDEPEDAPARRRRWHPLVFVGGGLCIMVLGFLLIQAISGWWQTTLNQWQYGYPRTSQTDAVVGHSDSESNPSHFIALNLHGHVQVIEYPGGDVTHARLYVGPTLLGTDNDLAPVTLSFRDVNGDGKVDMIINAGSTITVLINDNGQFRPLKPGEQVTL